MCLQPSPGTVLYAAGMAIRPSFLRATAFLLVAALGVHQLRYSLAYGDSIDDGLAHQGHGYLMFLTPLVGVVLAFALAGLLIGLARCSATTPSSTVRVRRLWPLATAGLLAIYGTQEVLEGFLAAGHPGGVGALVAGGGWIAFPLAVMGGAIVAVAVRVAVFVQRRAAGAAHVSLVFSLRPGVLVAPAVRPLSWITPGRLLASGLASRGPPSALST